MDENDIRNRYLLLISRLIEVFSKSGIQDFFSGENRVLYYLYQKNKDRIYPSDISKDLRFTRQRVTSILNSLKRKNYIESNPDIGDGRKVIITMTDLGIEYYSSFFKKGLVEYANMIEAVGSDRMDGAYDDIEEIVTALEVYLQKIISQR